MDDSGTVVVAATNARLAIVAGLSLVPEAAAHGRRESSMVSVSLATPLQICQLPARVDTTAVLPSAEDLKAGSMSGAAGCARAKMPVTHSASSLPQNQQKRWSLCDGLLAVVPDPGSVAGFSVLRIHREQRCTTAAPRTVANAGAIDLAANATKGRSRASCAR